jgi:3-hydroxyisobutyrate dehydrogenase-like beta-hydroxyacid dehydrogenase
MSAFDFRQAQVVNTIVASTNHALAEALNLGRRNGLDWPTMIDIIAASAVNSPYIASKVEKLKQRDWSAAASIDLIAKDMDLALDVARLSATSIPMAAIVRQSLSSSQAHGNGGLDMSALVLEFE